jgi:hypothetical protein
MSTSQGDRDVVCLPVMCCSQGDRDVGYPDTSGHVTDPKPVEALVTSARPRPDFIGVEAKPLARREAGHRPCTAVRGTSRARSESRREKPADDAVGEGAGEAWPFFFFCSMEK